MPGGDTDAQRSVHEIALRGWRNTAVSDYVDCDKIHLGRLWESTKRLQETRRRALEHRRQRAERDEHVAKTATSREAPFPERPAAKAARPRSAASQRSAASMRSRESSRSRSPERDRKAADSRPSSAGWERSSSRPSSAGRQRTPQDVPVCDDMDAKPPPEGPREPSKPRQMAAFGTLKPHDFQEWRQFEDGTPDYRIGIDERHEPGVRLRARLSGCKAVRLEDDAAPVVAWDDAEPAHRAPKDPDPGSARYAAAIAEQLNQPGYTQVLRASKERAAGARLELEREPERDAGESSLQARLAAARGAPRSEPRTDPHVVPKSTPKVEESMAMRLMGGAFMGRHPSDTRPGTRPASAASVRRPQSAAAAGTYQTSSTMGAASPQRPTSARPQGAPARPGTRHHEHEPARAQTAPLHDGEAPGQPDYGTERVEYVPSGNAARRPDDRVPPARAPDPAERLDGWIEKLLNMKRDHETGRTVRAIAERSRHSHAAVPPPTPYQRPLTAAGPV